MRSPYTAAEVAAYYSVRIPHLRQRGAEWRGPCPIHGGKDDNFAVEAATGQWYCHSQCGRGGSLIDLEMELSGTDFQHAIAELDRIVGRISTNPRIVATYDYQDAEGALLFQVVRYDPKDFRQRRPDGRGGWLWKTKGVRQVLYHLPQLKDADNVLVVEGEKDVQSLERLGFTATCNPGGAGKWRPGFSKCLKGKRIVILPDNDLPGQEHARQVADGVLPYAREVRIVTVSTGKDATDWINGGATREVIEAAIAAAPVVQTSDVGRSADSASRTTESTQNLPEIIVTNRQLRDSRRECLAALQAGNDPPFLFVRDGRLVAIRINETGRYVIYELSDVQLRGHLTNLASFYILTESGRKNCPPPLYVAKDILGLANLAERFDGIQAITEVPVLRPDGTVLDQSGYDAATKLYYAPVAGLEFPPVPTNPTPADIEEAVATIDSAIGDFPFVYDVTAEGIFAPVEQRDSADLMFSSSGANIIGTILTAFVRPILNSPTPLAAITAPTPGTGKTLLCEQAALIATGRPAPLFSAPNDEDEFRKQITAYLREGVGVVVIDNVRDTLESSQLCKALTATVWADRILGHTQTTLLPVTCLWLATGNNLHVGGDLPRRCYWVYLDAKCSAPHLRTGFRHPDLRGWTLANRGRLIAAFLTLARAWFAAEKPAAEKIKPLGSYESWCEIIGGILEHAGIQGFLAGAVERLEDIDQAATGVATFLATLDGALGGNRFTTADVYSRSTAQSAIRAAMPAELAEVLHDKTFFVRRLGHWFAERADRRFGETQIHVKRAGTTRGVQVWQIANPLGPAGAPTIQ